MKDLLIVDNELPADQNPPLVYLSKLAKTGRRSQASALVNIVDAILAGRGSVETFAWHRLRFQHTQAIRTKLIDLEVYSPATINRHLSALRGVLKMAWKLGLMTHEEYATAASVENVKHESLPSGRMLHTEEVSAIMQTCLLEDTPNGIRDAAIIAFMYVTGARRSEVVKLKTSDVDLLSGQVKLIGGKRQKSRTSYLGDNAKRHMMNWLRVRGATAGYMFTVIDNKGRIIERPIGAQTLYDMLERRGKQAGIAEFSPHDFRRTAISEMLDRGTDIATVAKIVGHDSLDTTRRYDLRDEHSKQAVTKIFDAPF